ncbi:hypothetical protein VT84_13550 [Gemmata sp. SH-PL17]|uniref:recombinase family protein n=1 Tax=Gemmata sp. SH-PL17 TaxID=1630693 RepID=UPI00078E95B0|nr:recombinase family protein [Gemmata sp. SH-PL17]AMV25421.1 hypothetical protein VT84_13550 [Gemmata sp. SH-PL17]
MPVGYSYLRFSSPLQASGDSIRRQLQRTEDWCKRNNVTLDSTLRDEGVSAFRGKNREGAEHALTAFIAAVQSGRVKSGSYLIVESLDRLSREKIRPALTLLLQLIHSGIKVVQLSPAEIVFDEDVDAMALMLALIELSRGHSESQVKSERVGAVWTRKHQEAKSKIVTRITPGWLTVRGGEGKKLKDVPADELRFELDPVKAAVVQRIFKLALDGHGTKAIAKLLNAEGIPPLRRTTIKTRTVTWGSSLVHQVLTSPAARGAFQPYRHQSAGRPARGGLTENYFPRVVTDEIWYAAQSHLKRRGEVGRGRRGASVHLFSGLMTDARDQGAMHYWSVDKNRPQIVPYRSKEGDGSPWVSFPAKQFERGIVSKLAEIRAEEVLPTATRSPIEALTGRAAELAGLIEEWTKRMSDARIIDLVAAKLAELREQKAALDAEIARARAEEAEPATVSWGEFRSLAGLLDTDTSEATRMRVRSALRRAISGMCVLIVQHHKQHKTALVRIQFVSDLHRYVLIDYHRDRELVVHTRGGLLDRTDIRDPADVAAVTERISALYGPKKPPATKKGSARKTS